MPARKGIELEQRAHLVEVVSRPTRPRRPARCTGARERRACARGPARSATDTSVSDASRRARRGSRLPLVSSPSELTTASTLSIVGVAHDDALDLVGGRELTGRTCTDGARADDGDFQRELNGDRGRSARASHRLAAAHRRCRGRGGPPRPARQRREPAAHVECSSPVGLAGIEPATSSLSGMRSNRLSYSPWCEVQR